MSSLEGIGKLVCVTGASGFVASWIVKNLLQRGYTVRASVRDPNNAKKVEHLLSLDGAKERLSLFKAAWKFAKEKGIDMVTINPAMAIGPLLQPTLNTSSASILSVIGGAEVYPNYSLPWVNVKDVANAHILAYEVPSANGRYCLVERVCHYSEVVRILHSLYPTLSLPQKCVEENLQPVYEVSKERAKSLGVEFTPIEVSLKETVESLKEKKFVSF